MKVLFTCLSRSWGGMEMFAIATVKQLLSRNIETEFVCPTDSPLHKEALKENIIVHTNIFSNYINPSTIFFVYSLLQKKNFDIIECGGSKDLWLIVPVLKMAGLKTPLFLSKQMGSSVNKKDFLHKWIYNRVDITFAISTMIKNNLLETTPQSENKIKLLHNSVNTKYFNPALFDPNKVRNEFNIKEDNILIGMVARLSYGKGHEEFFAMAHRVIQKHPNLRCLIVGEAAKNEKEFEIKFKKMVVDLGIEDKVIFAGFRRDIPDILAALDVFVFPSPDEAFGIALTEALSMGKANLCTRAAGVLDIAVDNETSFLFDVRNVDQMVEKLETLIEQPELRKQMGQNARKRAIEHFDIEVFTDKLIAHFKDALH